MKKRQYILISISIGLSICIATSGYIYAKRQILLKERHHLLCEVLKPGMSENEVITILKQEGDFIMSRSESGGGGDIGVTVNFIDSKVKDQYGLFSVVFFDNKYMRAVVSRFDDKPEIICDFYQPP
jgi:hypothetical protein